MIYRENYILHFLTNDKADKPNHDEMSNYQYALSLTPKKKTFKQPKRTHFKDNGQYRLNVYYSRTNSKNNQFFCKTPMRFTKEYKFFKDFAKTDKNCKILPDIKMMTKYKTFGTSDFDSKKGEKFGKIAKQVDHESNEMCLKHHRIFKDIGLGTDD